VKTNFEISAPLTEIERRLVDAYQRGFPLSPQPYADVARTLGVEEIDVLNALDRLAAAGIVSRVGAVLRPHALGASTLAAMAVPGERLDEVAAIVSSYSEVNHNYERENELNLWFVAVAPDVVRLTRVLDDIERRAGLTVHRLPMIENYHIDLGFKLQWA
jgi:siroheme decarboxylase